MTTPLLSRHTPIKILEQIRKRIRVEKRYQSSFDSVSSEKQLVSLFSDEELQGMMMTFNVLHPHGCQPTELETPTFALHSFRNTIRVKMHPIEYKYLADPFVEVKSSYELVKIFGQSRLRGALLVYNHIYPLNTNANANANANTSTSTGTNTADVQQQGELPIAEATQQRENSQRLSSFIRGLQIMERMIRDEHRRQRQNEEEKEEEEGEEEGEGEEGNFRGRRVELVSELMEWDSGASDEDSDSEEGNGEGTETRDGAGNREGAETREGAEEEEDKNDFDPYDALQFGERTNSFVVHLPEDSVESHFG